MNEFKLLAIRPLMGCDKKYSKVLRPDKVYPFYNNYIFNHESKDEHNEIVSIRKKNGVSSDFFFTKDINKNSLKSINISAIVGKNGSGKSSLIEILFASIYLFSVENEILIKGAKDFKNTEKDFDDKIYSIKQKIKNTESEKIQFDNLLDVDNKFFNWAIKKYNNIRNLEAEIDALEEEKKWVETLLSDIRTIKENLKVEIFYEINNSLYLLRINQEIKLYEFEGSYQKDIIIWNNPQERVIDPSNNFFYTIILNYSHYALNSKEIGNWTSELFHKNDGYQTPIVVNPMRTEGNIDINTENHLVRSRLLALIFTPIDKEPKKSRNEQLKNSTRCLIDGKIATKIKIELDKDKVAQIEYGPIANMVFRNTDKYENIYWPLIKEKFLKNADKSRRKTSWDKYAEKYILHKLISISKKYAPYKKFKVDELIEDDQFELFLDAILTDDSHITFKLHQALNFLKHDYALDFEQDQNIENLSHKLSNYSNNELITLVPPPFLKIDIIFSDVDQSDSLNNLSSGQKQKIYSSSSLIYHLYYLDSVKQDDDHKHKYNNINIIFDEIELYYHPELQRTFINDFIKSVSNVKFKHLENINCLFITHAPFILSDIPKFNVLSLEISNENDPGSYSLPFETSEDIQTFAANIHTLLISNFFMDSTIGEFAISKINTLTKDLADIIIELKSPKPNLKKIKVLRTKLEVSDTIKIIEMIGDVVVKDKLLQMYFIANEKSEIEAMRKFYNEKLSNLKS